jgi:hypothetical protein
LEPFNNLKFNNVASPSPHRHGFTPRSATAVISHLKSLDGLC